MFLSFSEKCVFLNDSAQHATEDQKEGMSAFIDKRKPAFKNR